MSSSSWSSGISQQLSIFRSQILRRRFGDDSLRILECVLASSDVESLLHLRSSVKQLLRSECQSIIRDIASKNVDHQLSVLEFLVRAFALVADIESCLALRYEALLLRKHKSASCDQLQVSFAEWFSFAEQSFDHGFHEIAVKNEPSDPQLNSTLASERSSHVNLVQDSALGLYQLLPQWNHRIYGQAMACDNALASVQRIDVAEPLPDEQVWRLQVFERINRLKSSALISAGSNSVRAQAVEYLKKFNSDDQTKTEFSSVGKAQQTASTLYRNGMKTHNERRLHTLKNLRLRADGSNSLFHTGGNFSEIHSSMILNLT